MKIDSLAKIFLTLLFGVFVGATIIWFALKPYLVSKNQEESSSISQISKLEVKEKCSDHRDEIEEKMSKTFWTSYNIEEIFYSEVRNSCLYSVVAYQESSSLSGTEFGAYMIWDLFDDELIFYRDTSLTNGLDIQDMYHNAVDYLQGEGSLKYDEKLWNL